MVEGYFSRNTVFVRKACAFRETHFRKKNVLHFPKKTFPKIHETISELNNKVRTVGPVHDQALAVPCIWCHASPTCLSQVIPSLNCAIRHITQCATLRGILGTWLKPQFLCPSRLISRASRQPHSMQMDQLHRSPHGSNIGGPRW